MLPAFDTPRRMPAEVDLTLLWSALFLLLIGMVMVYSASIAIAEAGRFTGNHPAYFLVRHGVFLTIGLVAAGFAFQVPLTTWQQLAPWLFVAGFLLLALVLIPGVGRDVNGARRWLSLGVANLQPSELMKLFAVLYAADYTVRKMAHMHELKRAFLPMAGAMVAVGILLLKEPDFGAFVVIITLAIGILFLGGMRARLFAILIVVLALAFAVLIIVSPYRRDRIFGFMDPWSDAFGRGYQLSHALIAFGRGELLGVGLGASVEKLFYLPEAHTDFILSVVGEELGFIGVVVIVGMFFLLVQRAMRIAVAAPEPFGRFLALGIAVLFGIEATVNMGVVTGLLPTKGLALPFISYGGSSLIISLFAVGILLNISSGLKISSISLKEEK